MGVTSLRIRLSGDCQDGSSRCDRKIDGSAARNGVRFLLAKLEEIP